MVLNTFKFEFTLIIPGMFYTNYLRKVFFQLGEHKRWKYQQRYKSDGWKRFAAGKMVPEVSRPSHKSANLNCVHFFRIEFVQLMVE